MDNTFVEATDFLRATIFPDRCAFCDRVIAHKAKVCKFCRNEVAVIRGERCYKCGMPKKECDCKGRSKYYTGITAPFKYSGIVKSGIKRWKYADAQVNTDFFAEMISAAICETFPDVEFDVVTFIPQTEDEEAERGYNQGEILAQAVGKKMFLHVKPLFVKLFSTDRQHDLKRHLKSGNVFGVFDCIDSEYIKSKTVLIIDDVKTSGHTINECAKMLQIYDVNEVYCAVIAITDKENQSVKKD